jgi:hypothetical protein
MADWFGGHNFVYFAPVPLVVLACVIGIFRSADSGQEARAFILMEAIVAQFRAIHIQREKALCSRLSILFQPSDSQRRERPLMMTPPVQ